MTQRGVTAGLPSKVSDPKWSSIADGVRGLPTCWIREDLLFWEVCWNPGEIVAPERLDAVMVLCISSGKKLMLNVVPCPHPTSEGWQKRTGGSWPVWMRPDFRLWEPIRESLQLAIDHCVNKWQSMKGAKGALVFEWFNEPATGHASGGSLSLEPKGTWNTQFHAFCNYLLVGPKAVSFRGHQLVGPTLSFFGEKDAERVELLSATGGHHGEWWSRMSRRCVNLGIYLPQRANTPDEAAAFYRVELERILGVVSHLKIAPPSQKVRIHEWYVTKPMLGYRNGECDDSFRADCIQAIGETIVGYRSVEAAFFFAHYHEPDPTNVVYDDYGAFSGPSRTAMINFLRA